MDRGFDYFAIVDLKAAYDRVTRDKLPGALRERLPPNLVRQVLLFFQTGWPSVSELLI